jgi:hypothetical protein
MFSKRIQEGSNSQDNKIFSILLQNGSLSGIDERKKLEILEQLARTDGNNMTSAEGQVAIIRVMFISNHI